MKLITEIRLTVLFCPCVPPLLLRVLASSPRGLSAFACPGNSIDVKGKYLSEILPKLKRQVLDVEVEISFKRPNYNGKSKTRMDNERFRLVAVYNIDEENYHVYLTNISNDDLSPEDVAKLYGARWDIELIFKELKRGTILMLLIPRIHRLWKLMSGLQF